MIIDRRVLVAAVFALMAPRRTTRRFRIASMGPSASLGRMVAMPARTARGGGFGVQGVGLAAEAPLLAVGAGNFDDLDPGCVQMAGKASPVGASSFHADGDDHAVRFEPSLQLLIAGWRCRELRCAEHLAGGVDGRRMMDGAVRVHSTDHCISHVLGPSRFWAWRAGGQASDGTPAEVRTPIKSRRG